MESKPRKQQGYSTVSHFNIVHYDCHLAAVRWACFLQRGPHRPPPACTSFPDLGGGREQAACGRPRPGRGGDASPEVLIPFLRFWEVGCPAFSHVGPRTIPGKTHLTFGPGLVRAVLPTGGCGAGVYHLAVRSSCSSVESVVTCPWSPPNPGWLEAGKSGKARPCRTPTPSATGSFQSGDPTSLSQLLPPAWRGECGAWGVVEKRRSDLPGGPVVRACAFTAKGTGSVPGWGTEIPHAVWCGQRKVEGGSQEAEEDQPSAQPRHRRPTSILACSREPPGAGVSLLRGACSVSTWAPGGISGFLLPALLS